MRLWALAAAMQIALVGVAVAQDSPNAKPQNTMPASVATSATAPLPNIEALLARVRAKYDSLESLRKTYLCTVTQVADEFSSSGAKSTHTDVFQAFYVGNTEVMQHVSRDGKPLSPEAAAKEQERVDKQVERLKSGEKPHKEEMRLSASALLKVATFTNPRRETIAGRSTLVFDYTGDPHAKADDLSQQIMRELAGTLWVDEKDDAILRLTGTLTQNFRVGGGLLVNIRKGSSFDFRQAPVNGEIWFPSELTVHVDGRVLLLKGFNGNLRATFSDYRKMKTSMTILPGTPVVEPENAPPPEPETPKK